MESATNVKIIIYLICLMIYLSILPAKSFSDIRTDRVMRIIDVGYDVEFEEEDLYYFV